MANDKPTYIITIYPEPVKIEVSPEIVAEAINNPYNQSRNITGIAAVIDWMQDSLSDYDLESIPFRYEVVAGDQESGPVLDAGNDAKFMHNRNY
jgi:hypothetical protein